MALNKPRVADALAAQHITKKVPVDGLKGSHQQPSSTKKSKLDAHEDGLLSSPSYIVLHSREVYTHNIAKATKTINTTQLL